MVKARTCSLEAAGCAPAQKNKCADHHGRATRHRPAFGSLGFPRSQHLLQGVLLLLCRCCAQHRLLPLHYLRPSTSSKPGNTVIIARNRSGECMQDAAGSSSRASTTGRRKQTCPQTAQTWQCGRTLWTCTMCAAACWAGLNCTFRYGAKTYTGEMSSVRTVCCCVRRPPSVDGAVAHPRSRSEHQLGATTHTLALRHTLQAAMDFAMCQQLLEHMRWTVQHGCQRLVVLSQRNLPHLHTHFTHVRQVHTEAST